MLFNILKWSMHILFSHAMQSGSIVFCVNHIAKIPLFIEWLASSVGRAMHLANTSTTCALRLSLPCTGHGFDPRASQIFEVYYFVN